MSGTTNKQYMEAHHLIPMNAQDSFKNSLDVLGNVVSLCPNCHRMIHHGDEVSKNII
ncbi:MAG: HNH endonuclease [Cetobacterium sp.]